MTNKKAIDDLSVLRKLMEPDAWEAFIRNIQKALDAVGEYFAQLDEKMIYVSQNINSQIVGVIFNPEEYQVCYVSNRKMAKRLNRMRRMEKVKQHWKEKVKQP